MGYGCGRDYGQGWGYLDVFPRPFMGFIYDLRYRQQGSTNHNQPIPLHSLRYFDRTNVPLVEPTWGTVVGGTTVKDGVTWTCGGYAYTKFPASSHGLSVGSKVVFGGYTNTPYNGYQTLVTGTDTNNMVITSPTVIESTSGPNWYPVITVGTGGSNTAVLAGHTISPLSGANIVISSISSTKDKNEVVIGSALTDLTSLTKIARYDYSNTAVGLTANADSATWSALNTVTATASPPTGTTLYYAVTVDGGTTYYAYVSSLWRAIARNNGGTCQYNNSSSSTPNWIDSPINTLSSALESAFGITYNRMLSSTMLGLTSAKWDTLTG